MNTETLSKRVVRYQSDPESVYNTWFVDGESRMKAFRAITTYCARSFASLIHRRHHMKKSMLSFVLVVLVAGVSPIRAHEGKKHDAEHGAGGKAVVVQGELVDMACYMAHEGKGPKHADCARMCILGGAPLGLLAKDGTVYLLIEDHSSAKAKKPYAEARKLVAENAKVTGDLHERGGLKAIAVEDVEKE